MTIGMRNSVPASVLLGDLFGGSNSGSDLLGFFLLLDGFLHGRFRSNFSDPSA